VDFRDPWNDAPRIPETERELSRTVRALAAAQGARYELHLGRREARQCIVRFIEEHARSPETSPWQCVGFTPQDFLGIWDGYTHEIQRCDSYRYFLLYTEGGVYADMDVLWLGRRLIPDAHWAAGCFFSDEDPRAISNCFFGAAPGNPFLGHVLSMLPTYRGWSILESAGTYFLRTVYKQAAPDLRGSVLVIRDRRFYMFNPGKAYLRDWARSQEFQVPPEVVVLHAYVGNWAGGTYEWANQVGLHRIVERVASTVASTVGSSDGQTQEAEAQVHGAPGASAPDGLTTPTAA
jgi:hypothetical protein